MVEWLEKYVPKDLVGFIGPAGTPSALVKWLTEWKHTNRLKSALITGPSGCGKTLLARLACKRSGHSNIFELNCVNKRTKKTVEALNEAFLSRPVLSFIPKAEQTGTVKTTPSVIIIDEIDACDQGGLPALLKFFRNSKVPVICIAGDAYNKSLTSLKTSSATFRLMKPTPDQISNLLMYISKTEQTKPPLNIGTAKALASACNCDIRQSIIELYMATRSGTLAFTRNEEGMLCDRQLGVFEAVPKLFPPKPNPSMVLDGRVLSISDRLFHADRSMIPLMVSENYLKASPLQGDISRLAEAADSISIGNMIEGNMLKRGAWEAIDEYAFFSTARPCVLSGGPLVAQASFPSILASMAKCRKNEKAMMAFARKLIGGYSGKVLWVNYEDATLHISHGFIAKYIRMYAKLCSALPKQIAAVAEIMAKEMVSYNLDKSDWDWLLDMASLPVSISIVPSSRGLSISSQSKAALTRAFTAFSKKTSIISKRSSQRQVIEDDQEEEATDEMEEDGEGGIDISSDLEAPPPKKKQRL